MVVKTKKYLWRQRHRRFIRLNVVKSIERSIFFGGTRPDVKLMNQMSGLSSILQGSSPGVAPLDSGRTRFEKESGTTNPDANLWTCVDKTYGHTHTTRSRSQAEEWMKDPNMTPVTECVVAQSSIYNIKVVEDPTLPPDAFYLKYE